MKSVIPVLILIFFFVSGPIYGQETTDPVRQFRRTVFKLQQEMLELKEQLDKQEKELTAQKEQLAIEVDRLTSENKALKKQLFELDGLLFRLEDRLEDSAIVKLSKEIENLRNFIQATILETLDHPERSEKLLLDIINQPGTSLPKDLLILILAQQKTREAYYDDAISYYSTLLAEFFGSPYFSQAIYEMSEILGQTGRTDHQITLLTQLSSLSTTDRYSLKAAEKLDQLGLEVLHPEEFSQYVDETTDTQSVDLMMDASPDTPEKTVSSDSTSDVPPSPIPDLTGDTVVVEDPTASSESDTTDDSLIVSDSVTTTGPSSDKSIPLPDSTSDRPPIFQVPVSEIDMPEEEVVEMEVNSVDGSSDVKSRVSIPHSKKASEPLLLSVQSAALETDGSHDLQERIVKETVDGSSDVR